MTTPAPDFSSVQEFRESNRRMAESILTTEPAPYAEGGYVRRVLEIRGRVSGQTRLVPIAVISHAGSRYVVSPVRQRNWVQNLLADPRCIVRSRDARERTRATLLDDTGRVAEVVSAYVAVMNAPWALAQFPFPANAGRAQIEAAAAGVAVFRLDPDN
jgi:deazaflavin-dependent oxidoreductase (nitroreductase family)